jgi:uncharacterized membrane protein YkoI
MFRAILSLVLAASVWMAPALPAAAQAGGGCLSDAQTRAAIQAGQAQPLSNFIGQVQARFGGQVAGAPRLCSVGGRLAYFVTILVGGQVREVRVDAMSGAVQ